MLNFVHLRSSMLHFFIFWLDSCIVNNGEKFERVLAFWMHSEGFQVVSSHFWALLCTGVTSWGHRSDRSECWPCSHVGIRFDRCGWPVWPVRTKLRQLLCFAKWFACIRREGVALVQGEFFVVFELWIWSFVCIQVHMASWPPSSASRLLVN
jgi:hypothetical protein